MAYFDKDWRVSRRPGLKKRLGRWIKPTDPLRPEIETASRGLQSYVFLLQASSRRLGDRDAAIFAKVVRYIQERDGQRAAAYANELVELRKLEKLACSLQTAFEGIMERLRTATDLGDVVAILAPAEVILKSVAPGLRGVIPETEREISEVGELLGEVLTDAGSVGEIGVNFQAANEDAERILGDAEALVEQRMKERLPEVPSFKYSQEEGYGQ
jgi:division protein CdvB (Snf7/Vps24/ESCRT-III family)